MTHSRRLHTSPSKWNICNIAVYHRFKIDYILNILYRLYKHPMSSYNLISSSDYINMHMFVCNNFFELIFRDVVARFQVLSVAVGKPAPLTEPALNGTLKNRWLCRFLFSFEQKHPVLKAGHEIQVVKSRAVFLGAAFCFSMGISWTKALGNHHLRV